MSFFKLLCEFKQKIDGSFKSNSPAIIHILILDCNFVVIDTVVNVNGSHWIADPHRTDAVMTFKKDFGAVGYVCLQLNSTRRH